MEYNIIRGLDDKLYGIIDGQISEVISISRKVYENLSEEEQNNNKIYIITDNEEVQENE